jgi:lysylphosphatidylglycerol synthetase-like protein (DUF2156 family)
LEKDVGVLADGVREGRIAFANLLRAGEREELSTDLMRFRPGAPRSHQGSLEVDRLHDDAPAGFESALPDLLGG